MLNQRPNVGQDFGIFLPKSLRSFNNLTAEVVTGLDGLLALREDWQKLIELNPTASPYTSWAWIESWIENYGQARDFLTIVVYRGYDVAAIVPFTWKRRTSPLEIRKMWMLGFHSSVGRNGLTEEPIFAMTGDESIQESVWGVVHDELRRLVENGRWDSAAYRKFGNGIDGCSVHEQSNSIHEVRSFQRGCEYVDLPETWDLYLKSMSKSMRENIPYYHKKFQREGIEYSVQEVEWIDLPVAVNHLIRLHKKRTYTDSSFQHVDYFGDRRQQKLLLAAVMRMAMVGEAKVMTLQANGQVIAAQAFLINKNMILAHYSGFDPAWSKFSPLFVLQTEVIKDAISKGCKTLNLLRGNASWQRRWGADSRNQIVDMTIGRRKFVPRVRQVLRHREAMVVDMITNASRMRRLRATYRTWQLTRKSA